MQARDRMIWGPLASSRTSAHVGANALVDAEHLARHLLLAQHDGLGAAQVDDQIALLDATHDAVDDLALPVLVLVVDHLALGAADLLDDHLLGGLRRDAPELGGVELQTDLVVDLGLGIVLAGVFETLISASSLRVAIDHGLELEQLDLAGADVELGLDLALGSP